MKRCTSPPSRPGLFLIGGFFISWTAWAGFPPGGDPGSIAVPTGDSESAFGVLTEEEAVEIALQNSRNLASLTANSEIAGYRLDSSGRIGNPELRIADVSTRYIADGIDEMRIGLRWRFPRMGALREERQEARVDLTKRRVEENRYRQGLIARVRKNYAEVLLVDRLAELVAEETEIEQRRVRILEEMVGVTGERSVLHLARARMRHAESQNLLARVLQNRRVARQNLTLRFGIPEQASLLRGKIPEAVLPLEELIDLAFENRPETALVEEQIRLAVTQRRTETWKRMPWPTFIDLSYHREKRRNEDWGELLMGFHLPLFDFNQGNIRATRLAVLNRENASDAIRESIADEVRTAYAVYQDLWLDWKRFSRDAEELISRAGEIVARTREHRTLRADEVCEMELLIVETKKNLCEKRCNLAHALIDLYQAAGIEHPEPWNE